jgi:hypothetical protein
MAGLCRLLDWALATTTISKSISNMYATQRQLVPQKQGASHRRRLITEQSQLNFSTSSAQPTVIERPNCNLTSVLFSPSFLKTSFSTPKAKWLLPEEKK